MAKDPAFLFYTDNFQSGTQFFTDEQVGKYIRLLCAQHLHGHLSEKQVLMICKTKDEEVMSKFIKDAEGKYYNERLEMEVLKRKNFSESRANNRLGKTKKAKKHLKKKSLTSDIHLGNENGNESEDKKGIEKPLVFPFTSQAFMNHWEILSKTKKWKGKEQSALQASLKKLSGYNEATAIKIMEDCIAGGWQGLVTDKYDKQKNNGTGQNGLDKLEGEADRILRGE